MMKQKRREKTIAWISNSSLLLSVAFLIACANESNQSKASKSDSEKVKLLLPVFGESKLGANKDTLYHTIAPFSFVNQFKDTVTEKTVRNKIFVADFFFATCQSICPKMSAQLTRVQSTYLADSNFLILSHTVNPDYDKVDVLNAYGKLYGAIRNKWHLMTGDKKDIYGLAKSSYLVNALEDDGSEQGFLHSETFLLIDNVRRIRGIYDGTDSLDVNRLISEIKILKTELENEK
jgi:protein SCO1